MNNLRLCIFKEEKDCETSVGYFHTWEQISAGKTAFMRGIVEKVAPTFITFTDRKQC